MPPESPNKLPTRKGQFDDVDLGGGIERSIRIFNRQMIEVLSDMITDGQITKEMTVEQLINILKEKIK